MVICYLLLRRFSVLFPRFPDSLSPENQTVAWLIFLFNPIAALAKKAIFRLSSERFCAKREPDWNQTDVLMWPRHETIFCQAMAKLLPPPLHQPKWSEDSQVKKFAWRGMIGICCKHLLISFLLWVSLSSLFAAACCVLTIVFKTCAM